MYEEALSNIPQAALFLGTFSCGCSSGLLIRILQGCCLLLSVTKDDATSVTELPQEPYVMDDGS